VSSLEEKFKAYVGGRIGYSCGNLYYKGTIKDISLSGEILFVSFVGKMKECYGAKTSGEWQEVEKTTTFNLVGAEYTTSEGNKDKLLIFLADDGYLSLFSQNDEGVCADEAYERELEDCVNGG